MRPRKAKPEKVAALLLTDLPRPTLEEWRKVLAEAVQWFGRLPLTDEEAMAQNRAMVGLRQMQWHVTYAIDGESAPMVYLPRKRD